MPNEIVQFLGYTKVRGLRTDHAVKAFLKELIPDRFEQLAKDNGLSEDTLRLLLHRVRRNNPEWDHI
eukprot:4407108-Prorocentrum_lima.AAC.1